jgi:2-aminoadipate transaminase
MTPSDSPAPAYRFAARARSVGAGDADVPEDIIDLSGGYAFPRYLPDLAREATVAAAGYRTETMQYSDVMGLEDLRELIAQFVASDGVVCRPDEILIVNGAKHGLDLLCRVFIEPHDKVIVTAPSYMTALSIFRTHEVAFVTVHQDEEGLMTDELEAALSKMAAAGEALPKLLFDVPDFHNPTGITTTLARRQRLIALAERFGFVIVEDDPYRRIRFEGEPVPPMKSLDKKGVVIALGTASKIVAPGLRIGWVIAQPDVIRRMAAQKADGGTSPLNQRIFAELLRSNHITRHVVRLISELRVHRDAMVAEIRSQIPEARVRPPQGGYFLWLRLPVGIDADLLAGIALKLGVKVYPGRLCFPGEPEENALRLCYSYEETERLIVGIRRLAEAFRQVRSNSMEAETKESLAAQSRRLTTY